MASCSPARAQAQGPRRAGAACGRAWAVLGTWGGAPLRRTTPTPTSALAGGPLSAATLAAQPRWAARQAEVLPQVRRLQTRPSEGLEGGAQAQEADHGNFTSRRLLQRQGVPLMFVADQLWELGFRGQGVRMGVFDTGIRSDHPHVKNIQCVAPRLPPWHASPGSPCRPTRGAAPIRERTNWTHEPTLEDGLGHGTFVAGVIGGVDASCPGFAPEVELYTFRVFTNDQVRGMLCMGHRPGCLLS